MQYFIVPLCDENKCLDIENNSKDKKAKIIVTNFHGGDSQKWEIHGKLIISVHSGLVLDIKHGENSYTQIIQYKAHSHSNQQWTFYEDGSIKSPKGYCISVISDDSVVSSDYFGTNNQKWKLIRCDNMNRRPININVFQLSVNQSYSNLIALQ